MLKKHYQKRSDSRKNVKNYKNQCKTEIKRFPDDQGNAKSRGNPKGIICGDPEPFGVPFER